MTEALISLKGLSIAVANLVAGGETYEVAVIRDASSMRDRLDEVLSQVRPTASRTSATAAIGTAITWATRCCASSPSA